MTVALAFIGGALFGGALAFVVHLLRRKDADALARELVSRTEAEKLDNLEALMGRVRDSFGALSLEALKRNTDEFLKLADATLARQSEAGGQELEAKKRLIDQSLDGMRTDLRKVEDLMQSLERDREQKFGQVAGHLKFAAEQTAKLQETAHQLRQALSSSRARGQWGERMAEDVLRLSGFIEGVNYLKQKALETAPGRPDYTFPLPQGRKVHMDVKFPLDNYVRLLECDREAERESLKAQFLRDVRARVKEVTTRDYINPEENTLDYVLVFIPNEQVYAFINENDPALIDEALRNKVILCSPFTLYAILAIIRQAMDNFSMERTAGEILGLVRSFKREWEKFTEAMAKMGDKLDQARKEFNQITGTRKDKLDRSIQKIEDLQRLKGLEAEAPALDAEAVAIGAGEGEEG